jgi:predicted PurR-regulated permease PerM
MSPVPAGEAGEAAGLRMMPSQTPRVRLARPELPSHGDGSALLTLAVVVAVVAGLYFGRTVLVPLALAALLSFALAPLVRLLRRMQLPRIPSVIAVVTFAFLLIFAFGSAIAWQLADLAQRLPSYQFNIESKIEALSESPPGGGLLKRASNMVRDLGRKIEQAEEEATEESTAPNAASEEPKPLPVVVEAEEPTSTELLRSIVGPLVRPLATAGIVIVFVIFMLLKREDLRDRLIRLMGPRDLPRTSQAIDDAAWRVGQYLIMQLVVNVLYGIPIAVGLWLIGLPNPLLWGTLCIVLRFVPYIGPVIGAALPLAVAVAVDPGWSMLLWAGALFIVVELLSNNFLEPWLYGASAGLSPVAIIAAAVFWTWLWGPVGLLLSTPLTVCLVVLGRHIPQLAFLDIMLGNEPALAPPEQLYQRLLAGDPDEATERAEEYLADHSLTEFYDEVAIPALALAEHDRARGALEEERRIKVAEGVEILADNLAEWEETATPREEDVEDKPDIAVLPPRVLQDLPAGMKILCSGARGHLDDAAAVLLSQLLERQGAEVRLLPFDALQSARLRELDLSDVGIVALSYMNSDSLAHARLLVRRFRRLIPGTAIVVGFWTFPPEDIERRDPLTATKADGVAMTLADATSMMLGAAVPETSLPEERDAEAEGEIPLAQAERA